MAKKNRRKDRTAGKEAGSIDLKKLKREELLEIMLAQSEEIDRLNERVEELEAEVNDRRIRFRKVGSLAEASLAATRYFEEAEKAAALYLENIKRVADRFAAEEAREAKASARTQTGPVREEHKEVSVGSAQGPDRSPELHKDTEQEEKKEKENQYAGAVAKVEAFAEIKAEAEAEAAAKAGSDI